jgi:hypothetical protein
MVAAGAEWDMVAVTRLPRRGVVGITYRRTDVPGLADVIVIVPESHVSKVTHPSRSPVPPGPLSP